MKFKPGDRVRRVKNQEYNKGVDWDQVFTVKKVLRNHMGLEKDPHPYVDRPMRDFEYANEEDTMSVLYNLKTFNAAGNLIYLNENAVSQKSPPREKDAALTWIAARLKEQEEGFTTTRGYTYTIEPVRDTTTPEGKSLREMAEKLGGTDSGIAGELKALAEKIDKRAT